MLKYSNAVVTFVEIPTEVTLCINITGCPIKCEGCHSPHLWEDTGEELTPVVLSDLIAKNEGITAVSLMGGDANPEEIYNLAKCIKNNTNLKVCWYSGEYLRKDFPKEYFDYLKTGPYNKELGGLDNMTTNQRFYKIRLKEIKNSKGEVVNSYRYLEDKTHLFWKNNGTRNNKDD